jgi:kynurenine formamidase
MRHIFLSYELTDSLSGYGDGARIKIEKSRQMCCGDTSNNTEFFMPTHFGTHMDYPFHFSMEGKTGSSYDADSFIFEKIAFQELDLRSRENKMICPEDIDSSLPVDSEILLIKTFYSDIRDEEDYWKNGPGFQPETASKLKEIMPNLKAIAFDSISLTNFQNRELGRVAHKAFLMENDLLIIEDVNLCKVNGATVFKELIIAPLRFKNADGAPVTIIAKVE